MLLASLHSEILIVGVVITSIAWIATAYLSPQTDKSTLEKFYVKIQPKGSGWNPIKNSLSEEQKEIIAKNEDPGLTNQILMMLIGCGMIYSCLFGFGWILMGSVVSGIVTLIVAIVLGYVLGKMAFDN